MHAPVLKRTTPSQIVGLALVLGLVTSIAIDIAAQNRGSDQRTQVNTVAVASTRTASLQRLIEAKLVQLNPSQVQSDQSTAPATRSQFYDVTSGQIVVDQMLAEQNAVKAARERFIKAKFDRMATGR